MKKAYFIFLCAFYISLFAASPYKEAVLATAVKTSAALLYLTSLTITILSLRFEEQLSAADLGLLKRP